MAALETGLAAISGVGLQNAVTAAGGQVAGTGREALVVKPGEGAEAAAAGCYGVSDASIPFAEMTGGHLFPSGQNVEGRWRFGGCVEEREQFAVFRRLH